MILVPRQFAWPKIENSLPFLLIFSKTYIIFNNGVITQYLNKFLYYLGKNQVCENKFVKPEIWVNICHPKVRKINPRKVYLDIGLRTVCLAKNGKQLTIFPQFCKNLHNFHQWSYIPISKLIFILSWKKSSL